ncbi:unnamed protein product [Psylliodes chrysocephalus]|uniref:Regulatory protein zeste n=1 Tax=Psylliodes chrysocephalus TaxID=3402493 RepID=A0A9P0CY82_9CUCU|nr:unnamed protein product [Psylliodes chrysocephala]
MADHPQLLSGKFTQNFTASSAKSMWKELESELNSMAGAKKDWQQWRKSWHDMKTKVKSKNAKIKNHRRGTGGGAPLGDVLTNWEESIFNLIQCLRKLTFRD